MQNESYDSDTDIPWLSMEGSEKRKAPRIGLSLLIFTVFLFGVGAIGVVVQKVQSVAASRNKVVAAAPRRTTDVLNAESVKAFQSFDGAMDPFSQLSGDSLDERIAIEAWFAEIKTIVQEGDLSAFQSRIDYDRLLRRIELLGALQGWSNLDKKYLKSELRGAVDLEESWQQTTIMAVLEEGSDPSSRIVYAYCWDDQTEEYNEFRFWLAAIGTEWKIYDWERLDQGLTLSEEWGVYVKYMDNPRMGHFKRWGELINEASELAEQGDTDAAKENIRLAESQRVPEELEDFCWLSTGYYWQAYGETNEAQRCFENVEKPDKTRGAYFGLMICQRWDDPSQALVHAQKYENAVGPTPDLCRIKAELLRLQGNKQEAAQEWRKLLRLLPDDSLALAQWFKTIPAESRSTFNTYLDQQKIPVATVVEIANQIAYSDYPALLHLVEYLQSREPSSAQTLSIKGLAKYLDGQYLAAAELFQRAFLSETDAEKKEECVNNYLDVMTASGQVVAGWSHAPDPVAAFTWLADGYEEGETSLSKREYRQLIDEFRQSHPAEPLGLYHAANLAVDGKQFEEAEKLLKRALQAIRSNPDKEGNEYVQSNCYYLLTRALFEQEKHIKAYELSDDPSQRFQQLVLLSKNYNRWEGLDQLLERHQANEPQDPGLFFARGEIAVHEKNGEEAIGHFLQSVEAAENDNWLFESRLLDVCAESGLWKKFYQQSDDPSQAFSSLAEKLLREEKWTAFNQLLAHHRKSNRYDPRITQIEANAAWELEDFATFSTVAERALAVEDEEILPDYDRRRLKNRLFSALLRSRNFQKAQQLAQAESREQNDVTSLAILEAARGNLANAQILALQVAAKEESAISFYGDNDMGPVFLSPAFRALHQEYPVSVPYNLAPRLAVFLFDSPFQLKAEAIIAAQEKLKLSYKATPQSLNLSGKQGKEELGKQESKAYALRLGQATLWLVAGSGKFHDQWKTDEEGPLATNINDTQAWLLVGITAWTAPQREKAEELARQLAVQLTEEQAKVVCLESNQLWGQSVAFPTNKNQLTTWSDRGNLDQFLESGILLKEDPDEKVETDRQFRSKLYEAIRASESGDNRKELEVMISLTSDVPTDPLWLRVSDTKRTYGRIDLEGRLLNQSLLIPQLKAGLPMHVRENEIKAWHFRGEKTVFRP